MHDNLLIAAALPQAVTRPMLCTSRDRYPTTVPATSLASWLNGFHAGRPSFFDLRYLSSYQSAQTAFSERSNQVYNDWKEIRRRLNVKGLEI